MTNEAFVHRSSALGNDPIYLPFSLKIELGLRNNSVGKEWSNERGKNCPYHQIDHSLKGGHHKEFSARDFLRLLGRLSAEKLLCENWNEAWKKFRKKRQRPHRKVVFNTLIDYYVTGACQCEWAKVHKHHISQLSICKGGHILLCLRHKNELKPMRQIRKILG